MFELHGTAVGMNLRRNYREAGFRVQRAARKTARFVASRSSEFMRLLLNALVVTALARDGPSGKGRTPLMGWYVPASVQAPGGRNPRTSPTTTSATACAGTRGARKISAAQTGAPAPRSFPSPLRSSPMACWTTDTTTSIVSPHPTDWRLHERATCLPHPLRPAH